MEKGDYTYLVHHNSEKEKVGERKTRTEAYCDLGDEVELQAENYAVTPENWYGTWFDNLIPLVYLANGKKILFKNLLTDPDGDYIEIKEMHSPKRMLQLINQKSEYGALPRIEKKGLRDCQFTAEDNFEKSIKQVKE